MGYIKENSQKILYIGEHGSGKTKNLHDFFISSIKNGIPSSRSIIFVRNKTLENHLRKFILDDIGSPVLKLNIFTFRSFVAKMLLDYWPLFWDAPPIFLGFSESLTTIREFTKHNLFFKENHGILPLHLLIKLYERQQRRADNLLTTDDLNIITEKLEKSEIAHEANLFLQAYNKWLVQRKRPLLDYALQLDFFTKLSEIKEFREKLISDFGYAWLIDDIEDSIPAEHQFYESFWDDVKNFIYTGNEFGGVRQFMGSDPDYLSELKTKINNVNYLEFPESNDQGNLQGKSSVHNLGKAIYMIFEKENHNFEYGKSIVNKSDNFELNYSPSYSRMISELRKKLIYLKNLDIKQEQICIICPAINEQLQLELEFELKDFKIEIDTVKGSQILSKNLLINVVLTLLRLIFFEEIKKDKRITPLTSFDFSQLLYVTGNIDNYYLSKLRKNLGNEPFSWINFMKEYSQKEGFKTIKSLYEAIVYCREIKTSKLAKVPVNSDVGESESTELKKDDYVNMIIYLWKNLLWSSDYFNYRDYINEFKIFIDMLSNHIEISENIRIENPIIEFIYQLLNGGLSDNPDKVIDLNLPKIKLLTMQKLNEIKHESQIQLWFDITSEKWTKTENHPLINPYLFSKRWPLEKEWSLIEEENFFERRFAKNLRISLSLCTQNAYFFYCDYNIMGELQTYDFLKQFLENSQN